MQCSFRASTPCTPYPILTVIPLSDWLSSGRVTLNDPSNRASFRNPGDLWLADRFKGDSFPLASTLSEQLFHYQCFSGSYARSHQPFRGRLNPTNKPLCSLLRIVSKGKCLSHPHCITPCNEPASRRAPAP